MNLQKMSLFRQLNLSAFTRLLCNFFDTKILEDISKYLTFGRDLYLLHFFFGTLADIWNLVVFISFLAFVLAHFRNINV